MNKSVLVIALAFATTTAFAQDKQVVTKGGKQVSTIAAASPQVAPASSNSVSSEVPAAAPEIKSVAVKHNQPTLVPRKEN
jgi:hypothetical protein